MNEADSEPPPHPPRPGEDGHVSDGSGSDDDDGGAPPPAAPGLAAPSRPEVVALTGTVAPTATPEIVPASESEEPRFERLPSPTLSEISAELESNRVEKPPKVAKKKEWEREVEREELSTPSLENFKKEFPPFWASLPDEEAWKLRHRLRRWALRSGLVPRPDFSYDVLRREML